MTPKQRKRLGKLADVVFTIKAGAEPWPASCHEPLTIAFICPLLSSRPWQIKYCTDTQGHIQDPLFGVWGSDTTLQRNCMQELWLDAWNRADL